MGVKEKKKRGKQLKSSRKDKEVDHNNSELWPDLPQRLVPLAAKSSLMEQICFKGVTKSWRRGSSKCKSSNPISTWLELELSNNNYGRDNYEQPHTFNVPVEGKSVFPWYWEIRKWKRKPLVHHFIGCSSGAVVQKVADSYYPYQLWNPVEKSSFKCMPYWDVEIPFLCAALSTNPYVFRQEKKCIIMVLTGRTHPAFVYRRLGAERIWIENDSTIVDPNCFNPNRRDRFLQFTNGIWCKEKFYALSLHGTLAVIEDKDEDKDKDIDLLDLRITALGKQRAVPCVLCKHFREFLVESEEKILLVFLTSINAINVINNVEVYELDTGNLTWIKKESIGDRVLFLGTEFCACVPASRVGCKASCVYFSPSKTEGWWVYDMETGRITSIDMSPPWVEPIELE